MGWCVRAPLGNAESAGLIRQSDPGYFTALRKIHDGESVEVGKLNENTVRGSVGFGLEGHGAHGMIEIQFPCDLIGLKINHGGRLALQGAADRILAVRGDIDIVDAIDGDALDSNQGKGVDHIECAMRRADAYEDATPILGDGEVIRSAAKRYFLQNRTALPVYDVEHAFGFVADIESRSIGRKGDS